MMEIMYITIQDSGIQHSPTLENIVYSGELTDTTRKRISKYLERGFASTAMDVCNHNPRCDSKLAWTKLNTSLVTTLVSRYDDGASEFIPRHPSIQSLKEDILFPRMEKDIMEKGSSSIALAHSIEDFGHLELDWKWKTDILSDAKNPPRSDLHSLSGMCALPTGSSLEGLV